MSEAAAATPAPEAAPEAAPESTAAPVEQPTATAAPEAAPSFNDLLPEGVRGHELFRELESPDQLSERLQNWQAKPQVPENAVDYYGGEAAAKKLGVLQPIVHAIAEAAKKSGMPKEQFAAVAQGMANQHIEILKNQQKQHQEGLEALNKEWGDQTETNLAMADRALEVFGGDDYGAIDQIFEAAGLSNNPTIIRMFQKIGKTLEDDAIIRGDGGGKGKGAFSLDDFYPNHTE